MLRIDNTVEYIYSSGKNAVAISMYLNEEALSNRKSPVEKSYCFVLIVILRGVSHGKS